jgi:hypothetical protein
MYEPHIHAFSPHVSRGSADQQNSQPVNWMYQWHCFIQALADGNTPEAFFAHLTSFL